MLVPCVHLAAVADAQHQDKDAFFLDSSYDTVCVKAILPKAFENSAKWRAIVSGSSRPATRWRRKARMSLCACLSCSASSYCAESSNSLAQAKLLLHFVQGMRSTSSGSHVLQPFFCEVDVLKVVQVLKDGFFDIVRL